jgi:ABC-type dipeptide/oligopeptide/nickel transport system permease component
MFLASIFLLALVQSPEFWICYWIIAALSTGVFFQLATYQNWYNNFKGSDLTAVCPLVVPHVAASVLEGVLFPITWSLFITVLISWMIRRAMDKLGTTEQASKQLRCNRCMSLINLTDSFCPLCGADQSVLKHPSH